MAKQERLYRNLLVCMCIVAVADANPLLHKALVEVAEQAERQQVLVSDLYFLCVCADSDLSPSFGN